MKNTIIGLTMAAFATTSTATWQLVEGSSHSRNSAEDASAKACRNAENTCLYGYDGDITSRQCYTKNEDLKVIVGYGGTIWVWTATEVVGCSY